MAQVCANCAKSIGFFSRKKMKLPDGTTTVVCRTCAAKMKARMPSPSPSAAQPSAPSAVPASDTGSGSAGLVPPRRFRDDQEAGEGGAHPYRDGPGGDQDQEAIDSCRRQLRQDAKPPELYRELYTLHLRHESYDAAWCAASVLCFLDAANEEEQRFFEDGCPQELPAITGKLDTEAWWEHLCHEEEDWFVGKIFETVAVSALKAKIESLKAKNELPVLPKKFRLDPADSPLMFARLFKLAGDALGLSLPVLYGRTDVSGGLVSVPAEPPASIAGNQVLQGVTALELAFVVGSHLAMYRGEHYIKTLFPTVTELSVLLAATIYMVAPDAPVPDEIAAQAKATAQALARHLQPVYLERLHLIVKKHRQRGGAEAVDVARWSQHVETTAARAGLLLCGDLNVAKRALMAHAQVPGDIAPQERLEELMRFTVSESYPILRAKLGIDVQAP